MTYPSVTAAYSAAFALLYAALSAWVIAGRFRFAIHHGDGNDERMNRRIRAHGNFAEYVPFILILAALLEAQGPDRVQLHALLAPLFVARLMHPLGMLAPVASLRQFTLRGTSAVVTWLVMVAAAGLLLQRLA